MNKEQFHGWANHPVTIEVMAELRKLKESLSESLSSGGTVCTTAEETALLTSRIVGKIDGLNQVLGLDYEEEVKEEEAG